MKVRKLFKLVIWLVKIYANKVMFKFISKTIAVAVKVFLAVAIVHVAKVNALNFIQIYF